MPALPGIFKRAMSYKDHHLLLFAISFSLIICLLVACSPRPDSSVGPGTKVLKVGVLGPFSGPAARTGAEFKGAVQIAFEAIDHRVGDYQIRLVWIDSQSDPEKATRAYEQAVVGQGIQVGLLNWHSSEALAVMEVTAKHRIPHFFGFGSTELVNEKFHSNPEKYGYWMAKGWPSPAKLSIAYVDTLEEAINTGSWTPSEKKVALWGEDTDWARSFGRAIRQQFEGTGWRVISEDYFAKEQTDFLPLLTRYKDLQVPVLAGTSTIPPAMSAFIKQADEVGLESLIIADGLGWVGEWYTLTGPASDFVVDQIPRWTSPAAHRFAENFERKWKITPSPSAAGLAYDFTNFFIKLLQVTLKDRHELNRETIYQAGREKLWNAQLSYSGGIIMSEYKFTRESIPDPVVGKGFYLFPVLQYRGGKAVVIWPSEWKTANLQAKARK